MSTKYICAFRGRRDYYQVPVALAENGLLEEFVTDAYCGPTVRTISALLPKQIREKLRSRYEPNLPQDRVTCIWGSAVAEQWRRRAGQPPSIMFATIDRTFGQAVAERARRSRSNLLVYSHYAWEPFTARYAHNPVRVMFQFHPHAEAERRILMEDATKYPALHDAFEEEAWERVTGELRIRNRDSWKHADIILCASSFTRQSLLDVGADPESCKVIPYGIDLPEVTYESAPSGRFTVLFVGTGSQRKGLHHLLAAWQAANLPHDSELTLVCRFIDPALSKIVQATPRVRLLSEVGHDRLGELFGSSSLFVMPSLVEGFGQVYLEALSRGCPVVGTANTGLVDIREEGDPIWSVAPGNIDQLVSVLETLAAKIPGDANIRARARACAARWSWRRFRDGISAALPRT